MDRHFSSQNISAELNHKCRVVYDEFLAESGATNWGLTIVGQQQRREVIVTVTDPDGKTLTEPVTLAPSMQEDVHYLLLRSYEDWQASKKKASGRDSPGNQARGNPRKEEMCTEPLV